MRLHLSLVTACLLPLFATTMTAAELKQETIKAWDDYIQTANSRMTDRVRGSQFLWADENPDRVRRLREGEVVVSPVGEHNLKSVPHGLIHDWIGAAFIPNAKLDDLFAIVRDYGRYKDFYRPTVIDSKPVGQVGTQEDRFSMVLLNQSLFLKTALESEYKSSYFKVDDRRWYSIAYTTRVQEIDGYGQPEERKLPAGQGSGYIWRLYSLSRFEERDGGVYVELEAIALSRDIPFSVRWLAEPIVRRVSKSSLVTSLRQTSDAVRSSGATTTARVEKEPATPLGRDISATPFVASFRRAEH